MAGSIGRWIRSSNLHTSSASNPSCGRRSERSDKRQSPFLPLVRLHALGPLPDEWRVLPFEAFELTRVVYGDDEESYLATTLETLVAQTRQCFGPGIVEYEEDAAYCQVNGLTIPPHESSRFSLNRHLPLAPSHGQRAYFTTEELKAEVSP